MALTEAQAGSDLGLLRAKAEPGEDGSYRISGSKIFISAGDHDLAENIIHLLLARLPGGPCHGNASRAKVRARSKQVHAMATAAAHSAVASARKVRSVDREMRWR